MTNDYTQQKKEMLFDMVSGVTYVDAYCRYSSTMQDEGNSIEYQMEDIEKYCANNGLVVRKWYIDKAKSAKKVAGRDSFYEMIEDIKAGSSASALIVWKTNRAFRNAYESHKYRNFLRENNIKLISVTQNIDEDTSTGRLTTNILSDIDQYKSEETAEQVTAALRLMAKRGFYTGQPIPCGYKTVPADDNGKPRKRYAICENESPKIIKVFKDFADGVPPSIILEYMRQEGLKTDRGKPFDYNALMRMLKNDFYIGTRRYDKKSDDPVIVENCHPALIDNKTFDGVQYMFSSRRNENSIKSRKNGKKRYYYCTGLLYCENCGGAYFGKSSGEHAYYHCSARVKRKACNGKAIRQDYLENYVLRMIKEHIFSPEAIEKIAAEALKDLQKPAAPVTSKKELTAQKTKLLTEVANLTQMRLDGEISKEVFAIMKKPKDDEIAEIEMRLHMMEQQQNAAIDKEFIVDYIGKMISHIESGDPELIKYVFKNTVEKIIISDSKVEIYLAIYFNRKLHNKSLALPNYTLCKKTNRKNITK